MKNLILITITLLIFTVSAFGQSECEQNGGTKKCVLVSQDFVDLSNQIAKESIAKDKTIEAKNETIKAKNETIDAKNAALASKDALIEIKDKQIEELIKIKCSKSSFLIFVYRTKKCY